MTSMLPSTGSLHRCQKPPAASFNQKHSLLVTESIRWQASSQSDCLYGRGPADSALCPLAEERPCVCSGLKREELKATRQAALFPPFPTAGLIFYWVIFLIPALPFKHCNYFIYFYLVIILLTTGTCNFSVFFLTAHLLILNSANNGAMY